MDAEGAGWRPANVVEHALHAAAGDDATYLALLAEATLLVPAVGGAVPTGVAPDGRTVLPAYTSPEAAGPAEHLLVVPFVRLVEDWPDPEWVLAVDPGLPIARHLDGRDLPRLVERVFEPVNAAEEALAEARETADVLGAILLADLHLPLRPGGSTRDPADPRFPWWREGDGDDVAVAAFTSERRLRGCLGPDHPDPDFVLVDLLFLAEAWPDPAWVLAVNPGAPTAVTLAGESLQRLGRRLADRLTEPGTDRSGPA